jgi:hypothetical protein
LAEKEQLRNELMLQISASFRESSNMISPRRKIRFSSENEEFQNQLAAFHNSESQASGSF